MLAKLVDSEENQETVFGIDLLTMGSVSLLKEDQRGEVSLGRHLRTLVSGKVVKAD